MSDPQSPAKSSFSLLAYALRRPAALVGVSTTMLLATLFSVLRPWPMKVLVDNVLERQPMSPGVARIVGLLPGANTQDGLLIWCIAATVLLFLITWMLGLIGALASVAFGQGMVYDLAGDLFSHLERLSLRYHRQKPVGDSIRRVLSDCSCVSTIICGALLPVAGSVFALAAMSAVMWSLDPLLTVLALAVVPLMIVILRAYAEPMIELSCRQQEAEGRIYDVIEQTLCAMPAVAAFAREPAHDIQLSRAVDETLAATVAQTRLQVQFKFLTSLALALGAAGILWLGARHSVGTILVFLSYLASLYAPLETLMYTTSTIHGAAGSVKRVREILELHSDVDDPPSAASLASVKGHLEFANVTVGYEPDHAVLSDISLRVQPGQTVAIVGATGVGKSTLVSLIPRFIDPWKGRVMIDGQDVRQLSLASLRQNVALVLQEAFLFPLSVAQNIAYGAPDAAQDQIEAAAKVARAHEFISALPQGYDTVIGESGATLSGGERQRLSIARALLKDAPILILDEPTSALDAQTESELLEALAHLKVGRTTLIIAHRLSTVRDADVIVVLENGRIVEQGTHEALLKAAGIYPRLYDLQFHAHAP